MSQRETPDLVERQEELEITEGLTDKQAAILAAFERTPEAPYSDIADAASELLPNDESVTGSYAGEQIKQRRPEWFDDEGRRRKPEQMEMEQTGGEVGEDVQQLAEGKPVNVEEREEPTEPEKPTREEIEKPREIPGKTVSMTEEEWLRLVAFLHLFMDTPIGQRHSEKVMTLTGTITDQALD